MHNLEFDKLKKNGYIVERCVYIHFILSGMSRYEDRFRKYKNWRKILSNIL